MPPEANKVALISPYPPPYGGMSILAKNLEKCLSELNIKVIAINSNPVLPLLGNRGKSFLYKAIQAIVFYCTILKINRVATVLVISSSGFSFFAKVVPSLLVGKLFRKRVILDFVGGEIEDKFKKHTTLWKILLNSFDRVIVPTKQFKEIFQKAGVPSEIIPHIVDISRFPLKTSIPITPTFLAVKNLSPISGVDTLIRAFGEIKKVYGEAIFYIIGDGPCRQKLEALVADLKLSNVVFSGNVSYAEIPEMFEKATLFIHGAQYESFGIVLVEAFASGTPVVSSNVGGIPDVVVDGRTGFLVPFGDYKKTAEKMADLLEDKNLYETFKRNGLEESKKYSCAAIAPELIKVLFPVQKKELR